MGVKKVSNSKVQVTPLTPMQHDRSGLVRSTSAMGIAFATTQDCYWLKILKLNMFGIFADNPVALHRCGWCELSLILSDSVKNLSSHWGRSSSDSSAQTG